MMSIICKKRVVAVLSVVMMVFLFSGAMALAGEPAKDEKQAEYKLNFSFEDNLKLFKGEYVRITLNSGQQMAGNVKDVQNGLVHIEKLSGREYFDALILVKDISAIDAKFRGPKR